MSWSEDVKCFFELVPKLQALSAAESASLENDGTSIGPCNMCDKLSVIFPPGLCSNCVILLVGLAPNNPEQQT